MIWANQFHEESIAYGRTDGSDVITKPKFLTFTDIQILLAMGLPARASAPELC